MKKIALLTSFFLLSATSYAGLYRWVDDTGKVHYSDKVPVAASKKTHSELSDDGVVTKTIDPQAEKEKAAENKHNKNLLALEKIKKQEMLQKKLAEIAKKEKQDKFLLATYEDENELIHFFENKIKLIDGNTKILKAQSNILVNRVKKLEQRRAHIKSKKVADTIDKKIVRIKRTIKQYEKVMEENAKEIIAVGKRYKYDYQRFSELIKKN